MLSGPRWAEQGVPSRQPGAKGRPQPGRLFLPISAAAWVRWAPAEAPTDTDRVRDTCHEASEGRRVRIGKQFQKEGKWRRQLTEGSTRTSGDTANGHTQRVATEADLCDQGSTGPATPHLGRG